MENRSAESVSGVDVDLFWRLVQAAHVAVGGPRARAAAGPTEVATAAVVTRRPGWQSEKLRSGQTRSQQVDPDDG